MKYEVRFRDCFDALHTLPVPSIMAVYRVHTLTPAIGGRFESALVFHDKLPDSPIFETADLIQLERFILDYKE